MKLLINNSCLGPGTFAGEPVPFHKRAMYKGHTYDVKGPEWFIKYLLGSKRAEKAPDNAKVLQPGEGRPKTHRERRDDLVVVAYGHLPSDVAAIAVREAWTEEAIMEMSDRLTEVGGYEKPPKGKARRA